MIFDSNVIKAVFAEFFPVGVARLGTHFSVSRSPATTFLILADINQLQNWLGGVTVIDPLVEAVRPTGLFSSPVTCIRIR